MKVIIFFVGISSLHKTPIFKEMKVPDILVSGNKEETTMEKAKNVRKNIG